ncbi:hypothetical protein F7D08_1155 [Bifidobacterium cebidarum]|uniref:Uncharacterized protein n=1 Tax=Bifidobacterium cebidarum TaxID=2650773 RepID=A0A6I1GJM6_9BIFI|nr:hypothetical protein F7D08_1155 [Bifidobacterium cebidarum]
MIRKQPSVLRIRGDCIDIGPFSCYWIVAPPFVELRRDEGEHAVGYGLQHGVVCRRLAPDASSLVLCEENQDRRI